MLAQNNKRQDGIPYAGAHFKPATTLKTFRLAKVTLSKMANNS